MQLGQLVLESLGALELEAQGVGLVALKAAQGLDDLVVEFGLAANELSLGSLQGTHEPGEDRFLGSGGVRVAVRFGNAGARPDFGVGVRSSVRVRQGLGFLGVANAAGEAGLADGEDVVVVQGRGIAQGAVVEACVAAEEIDHVGRFGGADEDALDLGGGRVVDADAAGGGAAREDELGVEHERRAAVERVERHMNTRIVQGIAQGVVDGAVGRVGVVDVEGGDLDMPAGDLEGVAGADPVGQPAMRTDAGAVLGGEVDGEDAAAVEVEIGVAGADGLVVNDDVGAWGTADHGVGPVDFDEPRAGGVVKLVDAQHKSARRPERGRNREAQGRQMGCPHKAVRPGSV